VGVLHPGADVLGLAGDGDVRELGVHDLLELEGHTVDEGVVDLGQGLLGIPSLQNPSVDVGQQEPGLRDDEGERQQGVAKRVLGEPVGVGELQVVEEPEELQKDLRRLPSLGRLRDLANELPDGGVADPVVNRLELLVDDHGHEVAPPDLAVQDLPHRVEGGVGQPGELDEVEEQQVEVLEGLPQERERRLRRGEADELLDVGIQALVPGEVRLDVAVEPGHVRLLLGQDRGAQVHDPEDRVVDQPQLLGPAPQAEGPGLPLREGLVADPEEPLEAAQPQLELEQLVRLPRRGHVVRPAAQLPAQKVRACPFVFRHRARL
jgi:anti-sigma regulatory factor (Ser/Thr protein kinase)